MPLLRSLLRFALALFFRRLEVVGADRAPPRGPLVVVASHFNGLVDPALLLAHFPRPVRFLAKSTLWQLSILRPLLRLSGAIPVYRRQDEGADPERNRETFAAAGRVLAEGGVVAMFPEGISHGEPHLMPLKTGAARIALEAGERCGPLAIRLLPVGLLFDAKQRFRSRALVSFGVPIAVAAGSRAEPQTVARLTAAIGDGLDAVTLSYDSWEEAELFEQAAELWQAAVGGPDPPAAAGGPGRTPGDLATAVSLRRQLLAGYRPLREAYPERVATVAEAVRAYRRLLEQVGIRDEQLRLSGVSRLRAGLYLLRALVRLALVLPLAAVGGLLNLLPYRLTDWGSRHARNAEETATYKLLAAVVLYPATWVAEVMAAGLLGGTPLAVAMLLLAPLGGYAALRFLESGRDLGERVRAYRVLRSRRGLCEELMGRRQAILQQLEELVRLHEKIVGPRRDAHRRRDRASDASAGAPGDTAAVPRGSRPPGGG